jgi:alpha-L-fucosidase 2
MKFLYIILISFLGLIEASYSQIPDRYIRATDLAKRWDEGIPLGNGLLGALVWNKNGQIRFTLDQAELWDERPMKDLHGPHFSYQWVEENWKAGTYKKVQGALDHPYDREPAPTKIPGAAIEIPHSIVGSNPEVKLDLFTASVEIKGKNGVELISFVDANQPVGWIKINNLSTPFSASLIIPPYQNKVQSIGDVVGGDDLGRLGYAKALIDSNSNFKSFLQKGWGAFSYRSTMQWNQRGNEVTIIWTIQSNDQNQAPSLDTISLSKLLNKGFDDAFKQHQVWWNNHWKKSALQVPDTILQKQWYITRYLMGAASRKNAPPISLQAVWTADNGKIAPWKGDFHHDLNTELSYWPFYSANDLAGASVFIDHLEKNKPTYKAYTKSYFKSNGLNVPGVTTLKGTEMGGWIQYALSPTISSWLAHHYDQQWKYSMDNNFLRNSAYPWFKEVAIFLEEITRINEGGFRQLPLSSSPEFHDNSAQAWFKQTTNYDLALMKYVVSRASSLAKLLGEKTEADRWNNLAKSFPELAVSTRGGLAVAPSVPYDFSHRHFSHLMAIYPLGLLKKETHLNLIKQSLKELDSIGSSGWVGYSFAWQGNLYAHLGDGEKAAKALRIFSEAFCLPNNGFHVNGDQSGKGYANATYRPFTLEGNFAFASGLQDMLIQSHAGFIEIMPAIPYDWKNCSFKQLRTEGAFLVSAEKVEGSLKTILVKANATGPLKIKLDSNWKWKATGGLESPQLKNGFFTAVVSKGTSIEFKNTARKTQ